MILLDTNLISELMRPAPSEAVLAWFTVQDAAKLYLSAITEAELRRGAAMLPAGKRRHEVQAAIDAMLAEDFAGRILSFDSAAAQAFMQVFLERRAAGRPISFADGQIAAIARARQAAIATRNIADFAGCGIAVIDPWAHQQGPRDTP
ncbi:MAG: type II toxin-antitoxin system VapC family toxin [Alphaproteobacteria bacterium]|nr:type II toxin-antitoxin system VapC family toxin [Alphaproteobacteria bacterium]